MQWDCLNELILDLDCNKSPKVDKLNISFNQLILGEKDALPFFDAF
jgi:hypothetical protein